MDTTTYELLAPDVLTAAKTTAREWPGTIDADDAEQEIWTILLEAGQNSLDILAGMDRPQRISSLTVYGHRIAARYRDDYDLFSGNFNYSTEYVRSILEEDALIVDDGRPDSLTTTVRLDLTIALYRLQDRTARYADLIRRKFIDGEEFEHSDPDRKALDRAVDALTRDMNRSNRSRQAEWADGPGSRSRVHQNAEAA